MKKFVFILIFAFVAAGCGSDDGSATNTEESNTTGQQSTNIEDKPIGQYQLVVENSFPGCSEAFMDWIISQESDGVSSFTITVSDAGGNSINCTLDWNGAVIKLTRSAEDRNRFEGMVSANSTKDTCDLTETLFVTLVSNENDITLDIVDNWNVTYAGYLCPFYPDYCENKVKFRGNPM